VVRGFAVPLLQRALSLVVTNQKLFSWQLQRLAVQVHTSMSRGIQPFSTEQDGDTLFAASTQEIDDKALDSATLGAIASEVMWDALLASVPEQTAFVPPSTPPNVAPAVLAAYAGRYDFALPKEVGDMRNGGVGVSMAAEKNGAKVLRAHDGAPAARAGVAAGDVTPPPRDGRSSACSRCSRLSRLMSAASGKWKASRWRSAVASIGQEAEPRPRARQAAGQWMTWGPQRSRASWAWRAVSDAATLQHPAPLG
jgi:Peptidase family S58